MSLTQPKEPFLSQRQHRMLQDMGVDVFFTRQQPAANHPAQAQKHDSTAQPAASVNQTAADSASPAAAARAALAMDSPVQKQTGPGSANAAQSLQTAAVEAAAKEAAANRAQEPVSDDANIQAPTIQLNFVASPSLVYLSHTPLSALELRFLQDLCSGVQRIATGQPMQENLRSDEFRWPMVEASGTPARAVTVFCEKYRLLNPNTVVIGTPDALQTLKSWLEDGCDHWIEQTDLAQVASQGQEKKHLWSQVLQRMVAGH